MKAARLAITVGAPALAAGSIATAVAMVAHVPAGPRAQSARAHGLRAPVVLTGPARQTIAARRARFTWRAVDRHTKGFRCRLDGGRPRPCASGIVYRSLSLGAHTFALVAVGPHGARSPVAHGNAADAPPSWSWSIVPAESLRVAGDVNRSLYPGGSPVPIDVVVHNPHRYSLALETVSLAVRSIRAPHATAALPCTRADFAVSPYRGRPFKAPPGSSSLQSDRVPVSRWPSVSMVDRPVNQNGCMGARLTLAYRSLARRAAGG